MNHAFIIQVHTFPEQFGNIIKLLASPNHFFFINVDKKVKNIKIISKEKVYKFDFTYCLRKAFSYFIL